MIRSALKNIFGRNDAKTEALAAELNSRLSQMQSASDAQAVTLRSMQSVLASHYIDSVANSSSKYADKRSISAAHGQVHSQNNEDGIISEIFRRIGVENRTFVEVAAGDGIENTTRLLLETGWTGIWVEAGDSEVKCIKDNLASALNSGKLQLIDQLITVENIDSLLLSKVDGSPDYVSVDIDYNTPHIWRKLLKLRPRLFCIEYNAHYPPGISYELPYNDNEVWRGTTRFGASLKALEEIGREGGYSLVGCDIFGVNAFFVRDDLCNEEVFLAPFTAENHYEPPRFGAVQMRGHAKHPSFLG